MGSKLLKETLGWGFLLWLVGYVLGIVLFAIIPVAYIGWVITPFGIAITLWVLLRKIGSVEFQHYVPLAAAWTFIAVVFDYIFIVKAFSPADGYYKLDVYLYYAVTFMLPLIVGLKKSSSTRHD